MDCLWGILIGAGDSGTLPNGSQDNYVANNIAVYNTTHGIREYGLTSRNTYRNNILFNNPKNVMNASGDVVSGTITLDPQFVNFKRDGTGDYHLRSTSPAIDKGLAQSAPSTDFDGRRRPSGAAIDIGAYEFMSSSPAPVPSVTLSATSLNFGTVSVGAKSAIQTVTIKNTGTSTMKIPSAFVIEGDYAFGGTGTCIVGGSYAPGASCTASIVFKPQVIGSRSGSLSIVTSYSASPLVVHFLGVGR